MAHAISTIFYAVTFICAHKYDTHHLYLGSSILQSIAFPIGYLAINTMVLTYPREQQKARSVAIFLLSFKLFLTLGDVMFKSEDTTNRRDWNSAIVQVVSLCVGAPLTLALCPVEKIVRDSGVYVQAVTPDWRTETGKVLEVSRSVWLWLLVPFMFSFPFIFATAGVEKVTKLSAVVADLGSLAALALGSVLDVGSVTRRRRGIYGFIIYSLLMAVALSLLIVLSAKHVDVGDMAGMSYLVRQHVVNKYQEEHYQGMYYASIFFAGMGTSCTLLFALWIIGTLTNHYDATVRFMGMLFAVEAVGGLVGGRSISGKNTHTPLYVGCGILALSLGCVWMVVNKIPDTNNWSLTHIDEMAMMELSLVAAARRLGNLQRTLSTQATSTGDKEVLTSSNLTGRTLVLNRPKALNSLTHGMVTSIRRHLAEWQRSDLCDVVVLRSNTPKAFCAGGDVVKVSETFKNEGVAQALSFFQDEYQVNHMIASYPKPVVAVMSGYTMGGGVGLSAHAAFRVATETTVFAMPETKIGFFPDVGATFFLPRLDGQTGTFLGLTGHWLRGRDVLYAGIATHYVPSERIPLLEQRLQELGTQDHDAVNDAIEEFADQPNGFDYSLRDVRGAIDRCFKHNTVEAIVEALEQEGTEWSKTTLKQLQNMSPSSLKLTLEQLRNGRHLDIRSAFDLELQLAHHRLHSHDMHEGISALLVRKTDAQWDPKTLEEVDMRKMHAEYFETGVSYKVPFGSPAQFKEYPHQFGLPSEADVRAVVRGEDPQAGSLGMTREQVIQFFEIQRQNKIGVKEKVAWVLDCKTKVLPDSFALEWVQ
ncbi:3-hydroxyisobutyryl-CoA hydrolase [Linderina macrospora]|uniref:3-hydroxyisobutyryl-CoA hydrolase n=1 Tax=Linderina macrospora TaxID=4868 RepID=A0ACC1JFC0_9FUNG|nr:3-hydroxyisobutyryl-CoA hydrolase [Linderina macrospora]